MFPTNIYSFKVNYGNTRKKYEIYSNLIIKTPERRHWRRSDVFIVNFEQISNLFLVFYCSFWTRKCLLGKYTSFFQSKVNNKGIRRHRSLFIDTTRKSLQCFQYSGPIDDFRISDAILLGEANLFKIPWSSLRCWTRKLEVKYVFITSSSGANFYIYQLTGGLGMRKILAHGIRMQKNSETRETFSGSSQVFRELHRSKIQIASSHGNFINPEIVYCYKMLGTTEIKRRKGLTLLNRC